MFQFENKLRAISLGRVEIEFQIQNRQVVIFDDHLRDNHCQFLKISALAADLFNLSFCRAPESKQLGDQLRNLRKTKKYIGKITKMPKVVFGVKS